MQLSFQDDISYAHVKKALLESSVNHADTLLRALGRVDSDAEFRAAIAAAIEADEEGAVESVVYAQYPPNKRRSRLKVPKRLSSQELMRLLNERVVEQAANLLSDQGLRSAVRRLSVEYIKDLMQEVLVPERSMMSESPVRSRIREVVAEELDTCADEIVKSFRFSSAAWATVVDKATATYQHQYERIFQDGLNRKLKEEAEARAKLDIERAFEDLTALQEEEEDDA